MHYSHPQGLASRLAIYSRPHNGSPTFKSNISITHISTATALLEIDGVNFITDPVFDNGPQTYDAAPLYPNVEGPIDITHLEAPKVKIEQLPFVQGVLLSHEDHFDNLDETGRQLLIGRPVITTVDGAKNLAQYPEVSAIQPWQTLNYRWSGELWSITGTPCVHLPGGEVTSFVIHKESFGYHPDGRPNVVYFTGDTVLLPDEVAKLRVRYHVVVLLANMGKALVPYPTPESPPIQITMGGKDVAEMFRLLDADLLVPMHYAAWTHFTEDGDELRKVLEAEGVLDRVSWLSSGEKKRIV